MAQRVLATDQALQAARRMQTLLNGGLATQIAGVKQQGQTLSSPEVWDGPAAIRFRSEDWPPVGRSMDQALRALENLQRSSEKVVAAIIQAGSDGAGAGTGAGSGVPGLGQDLWAAAKGFVIPPANMGAAGYALFATRRGLTAFGGLKNWMTKVELGRWAPRDALGRFVSPKDLSWWETALKSRASTNWIAKPNLADTRGLWSTAGKWGGRAGGVLGIGSAALGQWMQDSGNPHLDTTARVARTAEAGIVTGGLGWGGAIAGAEAGGVIGSIFPGPGTVIGAFIGGIAGGVAGSGFGSYVVGHTAGAIGDAADWTGHEVTSLGGGAVHALESLNPF